MVHSRYLEPFRKRKSDDIKGCVNCCHQTLTKITGFVEIARTEKFLRTALKLFVFIICTAGFFYQTSAFLDIYLAYPTSQDTSEEYPEEFTAPAITICNNNRFLRRRLCKVAPEYCNWENTTTLDEFCESHKRQCEFTDGEYPDTITKWRLREAFDFATPKFDGEFKWNRNNSFLNLTGPQNGTELIHHCNLWINEISIPCNSSLMIQASKDGYPYKCFTLLSLLGKPNEEPLKLSVSDSYFMVLLLQPDEYTYDNELVYVSITLHDPRKLVNPMMEGVRMNPGKKYNLYVTVDQKLSLPPPYSTKCEDYLNKWKQNGGHGPVSKKDCIDQCVIKAMVDEFGCVGQQITYPNNYEICTSEIEATSKMMKKCHSLCPDACEETSYSFTSRVTFDLASNACEPKNELCKTGGMYLIVKFTRMKVQKFQHIPRFESIELFSYIGGYLGMWLGISLASMYDFVEMIYDTVYPFMKERKKKKTITSTEKLRHQCAGEK